LLGTTRRLCGESQRNQRDHSRRRGSRGRSKPCRAKESVTRRVKASILGSSKMQAAAAERKSLWPVKAALSRTNCSCLVGPPGEDRGNGHRTSTAGPRPLSLFSIVFLHLQEWRRVTSGLAPSRVSFLTALVLFRLHEAPPRSREEGFKGLWDCKVTPAYCACQERNTIGCILNNDGLGAALGRRSGIRFPQEEFMVHSQKWGRGSSGRS
jgi:hypothetical protein